MLRQFRKNPNYLANYHFKVAAGLFLINLGLAAWHIPSWQSALIYLPCIFMLMSPQVRTVLIGFVYGLGVSFLTKDFSAWSLLAVPAAFILTFPFTGLIHCASHNSIKPKLLNRAVGEIAGLVQLYGFPDWTLLHVVHHSHTDDPELDPHPPLSKGYWEFTVGMRATASAAFLKFYFKHFGQTPESIRSAKRFALASKIDTFMKLVFWFLILGPQLFAFGYVTSIAVKMLHYAWLNYSTHRPSADGAEIQNLTNGLFYRFANIFAFGLYYHKNHHLVPTLFNPKNMKQKVDLPVKQAA